MRFLGGRVAGEAKGGAVEQAHTSQRRMQDVSGRGGVVLAGVEEMWAEMSAVAI